MAAAGRWRDTLVLLVVFAVALGGLTLYTQNWPPAVIVESGSMMHADDQVLYGRVGTIDPGDLVLVKGVRTVDDVVARADGGRERYGHPGDVIVYYPMNDRARTPIIHRAVAYVEVRAGEYDVRWDPEAPCEAGATRIERGGRAWCHYGRDGIVIPSMGVHGPGGARAGEGYRPTSSGFITKGDNPATNAQIDQLTMPDVRGPVPVAWLEGKARGELPWLGLLKLAVAGKPNQQDPPDAWVRIGSAWAPGDLWVMLGVSLFLLVGVPLLYDAYRAVRARRDRPRAP